MPQPAACDMARASVLMLSIVLLSACASIDFDYPRQESYSITDTDETYLGRYVSDLSSGRTENESGFLLLSDGADSLAMRLRMIQRAERSLDLQCYELKADKVGGTILHRAVEAADRGVRVRLLIDDIYTSGEYDAGLAGLDSHPNIEVRAFNPVLRGGGGTIRSALTDFSRINRRMHNKSMIVDNEIAVVGGRNIAEEYFDVTTDEKLTDIDAVVVGPFTQSLSSMFDEYWNHETALPLAAFAEMPDDAAAELSRVREKFAGLRESIVHTEYADAVRREKDQIGESLAEDLEWAPFLHVYDSPDKGVKEKAATDELMRVPLLEALRSAEQEVIIVTPYFVPRQTGIEMLQSITARDVDVLIVTNSLASNNQWVVHSGYAPARKPLLESGVAIHEVRPDRDQSGAGEVTATATLVTIHTKAFVVDRKKLFIGSFNFDPRSANINTESGVIIESEAMASKFAAMVHNVLNDRTYEVFLDDAGRVRWRAHQNGETIIHKKEPATSFWKRFKVNLLRIMPVRSQL